MTRLVIENRSNVSDTAALRLCYEAHGIYGVQKKQKVEFRIWDKSERHSVVVGIYPSGDQVEFTVENGNENIV